MNVNLHIGMKGFFRMRTINVNTGKCRIDTGWFPNTLLNAGLNIMATRGDWTTCVQVGTNGEFPELLVDRQNETSLRAYVAGKDGTFSTSYSQSGGSPYYGWKQFIYRIPAGAIGGQNLQEVGVGWEATGGDTLISRAPILDPVLGTPTTITPLADELLEVTYELRYYPPLVDVLGPQVFLYDTTFDTITRAASVTASIWARFIGSQIGAYRNITYAPWWAYDGDIGDITEDPDGIAAEIDNGSQYTTEYINNSYEVQVNTFVGPNGWILTNHIRSIRISTTVGGYQTQFNAVSDDGPIIKEVDRTMQMAWIISWAEKV